MGRERHPGDRAAWTRALTAAATALAAIVTLTSSLSPNAPGRERLLEALEPDVAQATAHALGVVGGLVLLWLAVGVLHGRRSAGRAAIVVLGVLAVVHTAKGLDYEEAAIGLAVAFALHLVLRSGSRAERTPATVLAALTGLIALAGAYALTLTVTVVSGRPAGLGAAVLAAAADVAWAVPDAASSGAAHLAAHVLVAVAVGSLGALLRALLARARANDGHDEAAHRRAARLVAAHGDDSIAPFALRADKAFHFAGGAALAYRALRETAVVAGDPIGPPASRAPVMASFLAHAREKGWDVVLVGARRGALDAYAALGLKAMQIGVEAVVDPRGFTLAGRASKAVRKAAARVERQGGTVGGEVPPRGLTRGGRASKPVRREVVRVERHGWRVAVGSGAELDARFAGALAAVESAWGRTRRRL